MFFLLFDAAFSTHNLLAKAKAIAETAIAQSNPTTQYVLLTIEPFRGLHYILGPTRDLRLLTGTMNKYVEAKKEGDLVRNALENRDIYTVDPRSLDYMENGRMGGLGGARSGARSSDPNSANSMGVPKQFIFDKLDWRDKKRVVASYISALMTLDVVLGQFRDYSKVIYLYSCGIPGDALLDRNEYMQPGQWISNYTFDSVSYDALKTVGAHYNKSGALLFLVNPAGTLIEEADKDSGEQSLRVLATESGGRYFEGTDKAIAAEVNNMEGGYYEISFPDKPEYEGQELNFEIRPKKPGVQVFTVKKVGREKSYADMTELEKEATVMNILNEGPFSQTGQKVSFVQADSLKDGDSLVCQLLLPKEIARIEWTVFKIARNFATSRMFMDKEVIVPDTASIRLKMKWRGKEFRHDLVLAHTKTGTILVWK